MFKVYIAGQITGDPEYKKKFEAVERAYKECRHIVLNPATLPEGMALADYMRICFAMIDTADRVIFLPDYQSSAGAQLELQYCRYVHKSVEFLKAAPGMDCSCGAEDIFIRGDGTRSWRETK